MKLFKKKETVVTGYEKEEVDGAEVWMVSWCARYGEYSGNYRRVAKAFLSEKSARDFANSLMEAKKLLQYTENIGIKIEKQE